MLVRHLKTGQRMSVDFQGINGDLYLINPIEINGDLIDVITADMKKEFHITGKCRQWNED